MKSKSQDDAKKDETKQQAATDHYFCIRAVHTLDKL